MLIQSVGHSFTRNKRLKSLLSLTDFDVGNTYFLLNSLIQLDLKMKVEQRKQYDNITWH